MKLFLLWVLAILLAVGGLGIYLAHRYPAPAPPVVHTVVCVSQTAACSYV